MKDKQFQELIEGVRQIGEYIRGQCKGYRVSRHTPVEVRKIRQRMLRQARKARKKL